MSEPAISARNISVTFEPRGASIRSRRKGLRSPNAVDALSDVSFDVRHGEAFGIIGANGAGKSTLMRVLGTTLVPDTGDLTIRGATSTLLQLGVGFNPQLDGSRNIVLGCLAAGLTMKHIERIHDQIWEYSELGPAINRPLDTYSRGMQSRLAFAIATYLDADILLVDEVLAVGDESFKQKSLATMRELLEDAGTIVMVSHALGTVQEFCDRVMWLDQGKIQQIGDAATVVAAYREKHTLGNVRLVRTARSEVDQQARPLEVRRPEALSADTLRSERRDTVAAGHVDLAPATPQQRAPKRARKLLDRGWKLAKGDLVQMTPPVQWDERGDPNRYQALMSWDPIGTLLSAHADTPDHRWIDAATALAVDWGRTHPTVDGSAAWEPATTGLRAHRLASLIDHAARDPLLSDDDLKELTVMAQTHLWALDDADRFAAHEIAGLHQIAGCLALTQRVPELPHADEVERRAHRRLRAFVDDGFAKDGVHLDHTPSFHAAIVEHLTVILDGGLTDDAQIKKLRDKAEKALAWFVMPDGTVPAFGEATAFQASPWLAGDPKPSIGGIKRRWRTGPMRAAASTGKSGRVLEDTVNVFTHGGYVVARNRWPDHPAQADAAYLALMAGHHSSRRKHADDLSIVWFDRGRHLLTDAGRYETDPDDLHRRYVTSARAHNTVEIDDVDQFPGVEYGSGTTHGGTLGGLRYAAGRALFGDGQIVYRRIAILDPGKWLLLVDLLRDHSDAPHHYRQWFHPAADLDVSVDDDTVIVSGPDLEMHAVSLSGATPITPLRGSIEPRQGWHSPAARVIEPAWAFGWEIASAGPGGFATLLSLTGPPSQVAVDLQSAHHGSVAFRVGDINVDLGIDLREATPVTRSGANPQSPTAAANRDEEPPAGVAEA